MPAAEQEEPHTADQSAAAESEQNGEDGQGEYEYMAEGEGRAEGETQALAPATDDQAKAVEALDHSDMPDQDADDITAAEPEAEARQADSSEHMQADRALKSASHGDQATTNMQHKSSSRMQPWLMQKIQHIQMLA